MILLGALCIRLWYNDYDRFRWWQWLLCLACFVVALAVRDLPAMAHLEWLPVTVAVLTGILVSAGAAAWFIMEITN